MVSTSKIAEFYDLVDKLTICICHYKCLIFGRNHRRSQGVYAPQIFRKYSHFVLREAFLQKNSVIRLKSNILALPKFLGWLRHWNKILRAGIPSECLSWLRACTTA